MIRLDQIRSFFPPQIRDNPAHQKYILKEYIQLMILDYLSSTSYARKIAFIGGTNLRLIKGIDRFSEDLDFDCKNFTEEEFHEMTGSVLLYLERQGLKPETRENIKKQLKSSLSALLSAVNLEHKARDFEHLLFDTRNSARILGFKEYVESL